MSAISTDERREVARRMREYADLSDDWWADTYSGFYVEKCAFGNVERHREAELFARLADLIEPSCDRDALLALAEELERPMRDGGYSKRIACRIREALGVVA